MPEIKLNLLNIFALKLKKTSVVYEGETVKDIITQFVKEHKDKLDDGLLNKSGKKLNKTILILVNGRSVEYLDGMNTKLNEGDQVFVSIPLSGG